jgi:CheY-like chemotaxis protein
MADKKKMVLVIEDEVSLQEAVRIKLEQTGVEVLVAGTGEEGLKLLKKKKPDLVWLDILLPGINGLEVLRMIRENDDTKDIPVVVVSVSSGEEKIKQAFSLNIVDYLIKSEYTLDDIVNKIKQILDNIK